MALRYSVIPAIREQIPPSTAGKFWNAEGLKRTNREVRFRLYRISNKVTEQRFDEQVIRSTSSGSLGAGRV